jgi:hypothetical protein
MTQKSAPKVLLCALLCCVPIGVATAQVFKWVDEKGVTHYGERPPQGQKAQPVETKPLNTPAPGPASSPGKAQGGENWQEQNLEFQRRRIQRERQAERDQQGAKDRQRRCNIARDDLRRLESSRRLYDLNDKGERVYLDDAGRTAALERARRSVERSCS